MINTIYELPDFPESKPAVPHNVAVEQGWYTASLSSDDPVNDSLVVAQELEFTGESGLFEQAKHQYKDDLGYLNQQAVASIISDPSVDEGTRKQVLINYLNNHEFDVNLRERYRDVTASSPNVNEMRSDTEVQDVIISILLERDRIAEEHQNLINTFGASLSGSIGGVVGGLVRDVFPLTAPIVNIQSAWTAQEMGGDSMTTLKAALFTGSNSKAINEKYKALPLEKKKQFLSEIINILNSFPGTDYNKYEKFHNMILNQDVPEWEVVLENIGSVLNLAGLGGLFTNPVKYLADTFLPKRVKKSTRTTEQSPSGTPDFTPTPSSVGDVVVREKALEGELVSETGKLENRPIAIEHKIKDVNEISPDKKSPMFHEEADAEIIRNVVRPRVNPRGPLGTTSTANPGKAQATAKTIIEEVVQDGDSITAKAMNSTPGQILSDWSLPKLDDVELHFPDINKDILELDGKFSGLFEETARSPFLNNLSQRQSEQEEIIKILQDNTSSVYQQANSVLHSGLFESNGRAVFGKNSSYGWTSQQEALEHLEKFKIPDNVKLSTFESNGQWYIGADYKIKHDPLSDKVFGINSVNSTFLGVDVSGLARSFAGPWIWPSNMRLPEWTTKGAYHASLQVSRLEKEFINVIRKEIIPLRNNKEFIKLINETQETQKWFSSSEIVSMFPELTTKQSEKLVRGYNFWKRLSEYEYNWANRYDRGLKESKGHQSIYDGNGNLWGYGTKQFNKSDLDNVSDVWDFELGSAVKKPVNLDDIVALESPVRMGNTRYEYGVISGKMKLGPLPSRTLNKIEGYIPRKNKENWYVKSTYKEMNVNGRSIKDPTLLNNYSEIIGAASTEKEAKELVAQFQKQYPDRQISYKRDRGDSADSIIVDNVLKSQMANHSMKRGERLTTLNGVSRLEDPLVSLVDSLKSVSRLNMWSDYNSIYQKNFVDAFSKFLPDHSFPNTLSDMRLPKNPTPTDMKEFRVAQQLFEYYRDLQFKRTASDELWKNVFHNLADVFEKVPFKGLSESTRNFANLGMAPLKAAKTLASTLFLHLNPARQWAVQTQQLWELGLIDPSFAAKAPSQIPALLMGINSYAPMAKDYQKAILNSARKASLMNPKEYDDTLDALMKNGIPESVDLNMMLHGMFDDVTRELGESVGRQIVEGVKNIIRLPGQVGKNVGYGPAELSNTIGAWLFAKERWIRNNPGKDWRKHTAEISGDAWDINHAMSTRAAAMPYQDGLLSLPFQFAAIQHKAFMQVFSSKTLTGAEKAKLSAARAALFGLKGVPVGGGIAALVHGLNDPELNKMVEQAQGGLADFITNNLIDIWTNDPLSEEVIQPSDLAISPSLSPLPDTVPYWEMFTELKKMYDGSPTNPRFAFVGATGSLFEAIKDLKGFYSVNDLSTEESLKAAGMEIMEIASGYNNFAKYMMLKNFGDKADKLGRKYGLNIAEKNMIAQLFGITTWEEVNLHEIRNIQFERTDYIKTRAKEIHEGLAKLRDKVGQEDYHEFKRRQRILNSFSDPDLVEEIEKEVDKMVQFNVRDKKENVYRYIMEHYKTKNDKYMNEMLGKLEASNNPQDKEFLRRLKREGVVQ